MEMVLKASRNGKSQAGGGENNIMKKQQEAGLLFWICPFDEWFKLYL
jgi:hypothetical protein